LLGSRTGAALATGADGRIYAFGGFGAIGPAQPCGCLEWLSATEAYSPAANTWTVVAPMPIGTVDSAAATGKDGRIYVGPVLRSLRPGAK